jgi:hypothetical protein
MLNYNLWRSRTALILTLGITATTALPVLSSTPATASSNSYVVGQIYQRNSRFYLRRGTRIPVRYNEAEKIIVTRGETTDVTLTVAENIRSNGRIQIPAGSKIEGELRPYNNGTRFVAQNLILRNTDNSVPINATSRVITRSETITRRTDPDFLKGAAIGAAAAAIIAEIFGEIDFGEVLGGAGLGVLVELLTRGSEEVEVLVVYPERDLDLTLQDNLVGYQ